MYPRNILKYLEKRVIVVSRVVPTEVNMSTFACTPD